MAAGQKILGDITDSTIQHKNELIDNIRLMWNGWDTFKLEMLTEKIMRDWQVPDRTSAEHEREKLRREFRERFIGSDIRKDRPGKRSTYTLRYFTRDTDAVKLF